MAYAKIRYDRIMDIYRVGSGTKFVMADDDGNVDSSVAPRVRVAKAGTLVGTRSRINFIEGSNVTITATDDSGDDEVDVTIASTGGGGGGGNGLTPPVLADFSWRNQGGATATENNGIVITAPASASDNLRILEKSYPSTPATIIVGMSHFCEVSADFSWVSLCIVDTSNGKVLSLGPTRQTAHRILFFDKWNSVTSFNSGYYSPSIWPSVWCREQGSPAFYKLYDDGTNLHTYYSPDNVMWVEHPSSPIARTNFLSSLDKIGLMVNSRNSKDVIGSFVHWDVS